MEIAVVGSDSFVLGFDLAGIRKVLRVIQEQDLEPKIQEGLGDPDVGILVLDLRDVEKVSSGLRKRLEESSRPVVIPLGKGEGEDLRAKVRRALGVDLYK